MTQTLTGFIKANGIAISAEPTSHNPNIPDMPKGSGHYNVMLTTSRGGVRLTFSVGPGILESWVRKRPAAKLPLRVLDALRAWKRYAPRTVYYVEAQERVMKWAREAYRPDLESVLDCMASDGALVNNVHSFEEWANELGYDEDSRKAETIYKVVIAQTAELRGILTLEAFNTLLYDIERL